MSKLGTLNIQASLVGDGLNEIISAALANATSPARVDHFTTTGAFDGFNAPNDVNNPVTCAIIIPPSTSTIKKTLKGVTGDTGIGATGVGWTKQPIIIPMGNNQAWGLLAASAGENLDIYYL